MSGDLFDKVIIALLVITLPIAIFVTAAFQESAPLISENKVANAEGLEQKVESLYAEVAEQKSERRLPIEINKVSYATSSGEMQIEGTAPGRNLNVMVSAVITPAKEQTKTAEKTASKSGVLGASTLQQDDPSVLGQSVEVVAVKTSNDGTFTFKKKVEYKKNDLVELKFDQGDSSATVQYSISKNKRLL